MKAPNTATSFGLIVWQPDCILNKTVRAYTAISLEFIVWQTDCIVNTVDSRGEASCRQDDDPCIVLSELVNIVLSTNVLVQPLT